MGMYLDLDDVCNGHPMATKELAELRNRAAESEAMYCVEREQRKELQTQLLMLRDDRAALMSRVAELEAESQRFRNALHEIREEWAGAECGEPIHAQEAYAIALAKRMYALAVRYPDQPLSKGT